MQTLVLTIHILIALGLVGAVLLQRSEGGGLGIGGGGSGGGFMTARGTANLMTRVTTVLHLSNGATLMLSSATCAGGRCGGPLGGTSSSETWDWRQTTGGDRSPGGS